MMNIMEPQPKKRWKSIIIGIVIFFFIGFFLDIVIVFTPNAHIDVTKSNGFLTAGSHTTTYSTYFGLALIPIPFANEVSVVTDQYVLTKSNFYGFLKIGPLVFVDPSRGLQRPIAVLNQFLLPESKDPINPNQDRFDALSFINSDGKSSGEYDFEIQSIGTNREKIIFAGQGGIQNSNEGILIPPYESYKYNGEGGIEEKNKTQLIAPLEGYQKEMEISCGKNYVARLRDGKHYMKIYYDHPSNFANNPNPCNLSHLYINLNMYIQPKETRNMSFTNLTWYFIKDLKFGPNYGEELKQ